MSDTTDLNKVKNAVATICSNDLLKLLKEYQKETSENKTKIMFMKYFTTCRVRCLQLLATARWVKASKSEDAKEMEIATQHLQSIHREINSGWPAPMYDVDNACDVLGSSRFYAPRAMSSGLVQNQEEEEEEEMDIEQSTLKQRLQIEVQRRFLQSCGMLSNDTAQEFRTLIDDVRFFVSGHEHVVIRKNDQFEFKLSFTTKSTIDRARWYVPSVKFLLQADASDESMILPDDAELMSVRSSELYSLSLSDLLITNKTQVRTWMTAILNDENSKNPTLICARTLRTLSTKFIILTLRSQMESFVEKMNANHIEVKDKEEDGFDVNVYFSNRGRKRMLRCTLSIFNKDGTTHPDGSTSVCCRVSSSSYEDNNIFVRSVLERFNHFTLSCFNYDY